VENLYHLSLPGTAAISSSGATTSPFSKSPAVGLRVRLYQGEFLFSVISFHDAQLPPVWCSKYDVFTGQNRRRANRGGFDKIPSRNATDF